ncbi:hypothetical protein CCP4SC76_3930002 [Gammaproteobacteria bacterium]
MSATLFPLRKELAPNDKIMSEVSDVDSEPTLNQILIAIFCGKRILRHCGQRIRDYRRYLKILNGNMAYWRVKANIGKIAELKRQIFEVDEVLKNLEASRDQVAESMLWHFGRFDDLNPSLHLKAQVAGISHVLAENLLKKWGEDESIPTLMFLSSHVGDREDQDVSIPINKVLVHKISESPILQRQANMI